MSYLIAALNPKGARHKTEQSQCEDLWQKYCKLYINIGKAPRCCCFSIVMLAVTMAGPNIVRCQGHPYAGSLSCINYEKDIMVHDSYDAIAATPIL